MLPRSRAPKADAPYPPGWEPFLAAINADLDDDTPRLVFADWLQENGDEPRAEFIRIQCARARDQSADTARAEHFLNTNRRRWLRGLPRYLMDNPGRCEFRRGLVTAVSLQGPKWSADGESIRRITALEHLTLDRNYPEHMEAPTLEGLRELTLNGMTSETVATLACSSIIPTLVALSLTPIPAATIGDRYLSELFANPALTRLRRLRLGRTHLVNSVAAAIADTPRLTALEELSLQPCITNALDVSGAEALARFPATNLRVLGLSGNPIRDDGLRALIASPHLRNLVNLDLSRCQLTSTAAQLLADWDGLESVQTLNLRGNGLQAADQDRIAQSPHAKSLTFISVFSL